MAVLIFLITSVVIVSEKLNRPVVALAGAALMAAFGVLTQEEALTSIDANTIALCDDLGLVARPFLITQVIASNIGGTATLIGDPPNILIGGAAGLDFIAFLTNLGPLVLILLPLMIGGFWLMFERGQWPSSGRSCCCC